MSSQSRALQKMHIKYGKCQLAASCKSTGNETCKNSGSVSKEQKFQFVWLTVIEYHNINKISTATRVYTFRCLFSLQCIKFWNLNDSFMLHMLCKIVPVAYESTQNSNLLKILWALQGKRKHTNTVNAYAGKY